MSLKALIPSNFKLGTGEDFKSLSQDERLQELISDNFNLLTPANSLKLGRIAKNPDSLDFNEADWFVDFADRNNLIVRGHMMVWGRSIPEWVRDMESYQFSATIKDYIFETMKRYPKIIDWDVCGEGYEDNGNLRETILSYHLGSNWIERCLLWANEARPDARLFYSEFKLHRIQKQQSILNLIENCKNNDIPLDGISVQLHHTVAGVLRLLGLKGFLKKIHDRNLSIQFSEVTLWNHSSNPGRVELLSHAIAFNELLRMALDIGVDTFNIWGATDRYAWRFPERGPLLFDSDYQPKPAYHALFAQLTARGIQAA